VEEWDTWHLLKWIISTATYAESLEKDAVGSISYSRSDTVYSSSTGKLERQRLLADTTYPGGYAANDIVTVYDYSTDGNLVSRKTYGGDLQALGTGNLSDLTLPATNQDRVDYTYTWGAVETATPYTSSGSPMGYKLSDRVIDRSGLVSTSYDSAELGTAYLFDKMKEKGKGCQG
jgi:hypothetical protein